MWALAHPQIGPGGLGCGRVVPSVSVCRSARIQRPSHLAHWRACARSGEPVMVTSSAVRLGRTVLPVRTVLLGRMVLPGPTVLLGRMVRSRRSGGPRSADPWAMTTPGPAAHRVGIDRSVANGSPSSRCPRVFAGHAGPRAGRRSSACSSWSHSSPWSSVRGCGSRVREARRWSAWRLRSRAA